MTEAISMSDSISISRDSAYSSHLAQSLTTFREKQQFVDCKIIVGKTPKESIECHANVISALSPVFERMTQCEFKEGITKELVFETIQPPVMKMILHFIYTGKVTIMKPDLMNIVRACDYLQVLELRDRVLVNVPGILRANPGEAITWLRLAGLLELEDTAKKCMTFVALHIRQVIHTPEFLAMSQEELAYFLQEIDHVTPDDLLHSMLAWVEFEPKQRIHALDRIPIQLEGCSRRVLNETLQVHADILQENPRFCKTLSQTMEKKKRFPMQAALSAILSLIIVGGHENRTCWRRENKQTQFHEMTQIPSELFGGGHSICLYEGVGMILTGGLQHQICALYQTARRSWKCATSLASARWQHASVCIQGEIFVIGGGGEGGGWSTTAEYLNLDDQHSRWLSAPMSPAALVFPKVAALDSDVFLMGNSDPTLYHFDACSMIWKPRAALPMNPDCGFSMAAGKGRVFAAGGRKNICCVYNLASDCWTQARGPLLMHWNGALVCHEDSLLLLGGQSADVEEYNATNDSWKTAMYKLPQQLDRHVAFYSQAVHWLS